jgi:hypothetical protein
MVNVSVNVTELRDTQTACKAFFLSMSEKMLPEKMVISVSGLSKEDPLSRNGECTSNKLRAWTEQKGKVKLISCLELGNPSSSGLGHQNSRLSNL